VTSKAQRVTTALAIPGEMSVVGLRLSKGLSFYRWEAVVARLGMVTRACMWWWSDAVNFGEAKFGEMYAQAAGWGDLGKRTIREPAAIPPRGALQWMSSGK